MRRRPYSLVLLDEIEKAHREVWNLLLQMLEDGFVTDGLGRRVDFRSTIIVMTSNLGAERVVAGGKTLGFCPDEGAEEERVREAALEELRRTFPPELLNRIDETVVFRRLDGEDMAEIARRMLGQLEERLSAAGVALTAEPEAILALARRGHDPRYGARPLRRLLRDTVETPAADWLLEERLRPGDRVRLTLREGEAVLEAEERAAEEAG